MCIQCNFISMEIQSQTIIGSKTIIALDYILVNSRGREEVEGAWIGETEDVVVHDHNMIGVNLRWRHRDGKKRRAGGRGGGGVV